MPYIRKGNCVYLKKSGKKVGCSSSVEKAKKYIQALHANVHESFDSYVDMLLEAEALGLIGFTNNEGTAYAYVYDPKIGHSALVDRRVNILGDRSVVPRSFAGLLNDPTEIQWRYNFSNRTVYIWQEAQPKSNITKQHLMAFFAKKKWNVLSVKYLDNSDSTPEGDKDFKDSHFMG